LTQPFAFDRKGLKAWAFGFKAEEVVKKREE
jgi:hypothetical protein